MVAPAKEWLETPPCPFCKKTEKFEVAVGTVARYQAGTLIQDVMPHLTPDQRERFMTGICPPCWDKQMGPEE